mmetsp:Transcript_17285/g.55347  ORF Transcript_17285/g.55347 Transcript_17285/m.55347 type:complete len:224 (+) Transcript_17285:1324-1995(+)
MDAADGLRAPLPYRHPGPRGPRVRGGGGRCGAAGAGGRGGHLFVLGRRPPRRLRGRGGRRERREHLQGLPPPPGAHQRPALQRRPGPPAAAACRPGAGLTGAGHRAARGLPGRPAVAALLLAAARAADPSGLRPRVRGGRHPHVPLAGGLPQALRGVAAAPVLGAARAGAGRRGVQAAARGPLAPPRLRGPRARRLPDADRVLPRPHGRRGRGGAVPPQPRRR